MSEFKNLKVPKRTHDLLVLRARSLGMKVYTLADALLLAGLKLNNDELIMLVASTQQEVTPPEVSTNQAAKRGKSQSLASSASTP